MEKEIVIASGNKGKIKEAREILKGFKIIPLSEIDNNIHLKKIQ